MSASNSPQEGTPESLAGPDAADQNFPREKRQESMDDQNLNQNAESFASDGPKVVDTPQYGCGDPNDLLASGPAPTPTDVNSHELAIVETVAPEVVDVTDLDWSLVRASVDPAAIRSQIKSVVEAMEALLDRAGGPNMLFDRDRAYAHDRAIRVSAGSMGAPIWIIGDLHGDLLALEAALATIRDQSARDGESEWSIVFLGDLFDDGGFGLEVILRIFELIVERPAGICLMAGNHDEALAFDGARFLSTVSPSDFADFLNANGSDEWIERAGKLTVRLFARAPRALFLPDGLLIAHGGFPLSDLHLQLSDTGDWNDPACLSDFVWTRAHPKARKKLPNRFSRGSQFGFEDFDSFCKVSADLGRPVTRMIRGHDHVEERYALYPAYRLHPVLTTVALSRRLIRESLGPYVRTPTLAQYVEDAIPRVYKLHIPADIVRAIYPEPDPAAEGEAVMGEAR